MESHILPETDLEVSALRSDIIEAMSAYLSGRADVAESSETGEPIIALINPARRFRLQLIEIVS